MIKFYQDLVRFVCEEDKNALVDTFLGVVAAQSKISPWERHDIIFARASVLPSDDERLETMLLRFKTFLEVEPKLARDLG